MKVAVLVSGRGTNLQSLLDAEAQGALAPAEIAVVVSNRPGAFALERATQAKKAIEVVDHKTFPSREAFEDELLAVLARYEVETVVLAGFMRVLTPRFLDRFPDRILNIHPSLLPAFPGIHGPRQALQHGVKVAGCTVHFVSLDVDGGPIILQASVPVLDDDDEDRLAERILDKEHELLPRAVRLLAEGRLFRDGRRVKIRPASP